MTIGPDSTYIISNLQIGLTLGFQRLQYDDFINNYVLTQEEELKLAEGAENL